MRFWRFTFSAAVLAGFCSILCLTPAQAQPVTISVSIDAQLMGSREWDGIGVNSSQIDGGLAGGAVGSFFGSDRAGGITGLFVDTIGQSAVDFAGKVMAPPDPVLCLARSGARLECLPLTCKDSLLCSWKVDDLPSGAVGLVLYDSDDGSLTGGGSNDLIGWGVFADDAMVAGLRSGDRDALAAVESVGKQTRQAIENAFPNVRQDPYRTILENPGKISLSGCGGNDGCRIGLANIRLETGSGW